MRKQQVVSGVKWSAIDQIGRQAAQLITGVVLARLLLPSDFGLLGMAMIFAGLVTRFTDLGTGAAVVQRRELSQLLLSTVFWMNVAFGLLAGLSLALCAPLIADIYGEPRLTWVIVGLASTLPLAGLGVLQQALLQRDLRFRALAVVEITAVLSGAVVGIGAAVAGEGVWSLVLQALVTTAMDTSLLWIAAQWRPSARASWVDARSVFRFSANLTGFNIVNYFVRNADNFLVGMYLGAVALGCYSLAYRLFLFPLLNLSLMMSRVMFPAYAAVQGDDSSIRRAYLATTQAIALVSFPLMLGLMILSKTFVVVVFGDKWAPAAPVVAILAPVGIIEAMTSTVGALYQAKNHPDWQFRWEAVVALVMIGGFAVGLRWGIVGVAGAYATLTVVLLYPDLAIPFRLVNLRVLALVAAVWRTLVCSLLMGSCIVVVQRVSGLALVTKRALGLDVATGIFTYLVLTLMLNRPLLLRVWAALTGSPSWVDGVGDGRFSSHSREGESG